MSYASLEQKIRLLPESYLEDVSDYIEFLLFKIGARSADRKSNDISEYFGAVKMKEEGD